MDREVSGLIDLPLQAFCASFIRSYALYLGRDYFTAIIMYPIRNPVEIVAQLKALNEGLS
jgi:hypothetical protein